MKCCLLIPLLAALLLAASSVLAQPPDTLWTSLYGDENYDYGESVQQTDDGGFIIGGRKSSLNVDMYVVKTDSLGILEWENTYGGDDDDRCYVVVKTDDGGYLLAGDTQSYGLGYEDVYLVKIDSIGNTSWEQTYGNTGHDYCFSCLQTNDGGYILAGKVIGLGAPDGDMLLLKTDSLGNQLWQHAYDSGEDDCCRSAKPTPDGGYILAGYTSPMDVNIYVVKTDSLGIPEWEHLIDRSYDVRCYDIELTPDGGYILGGSRYDSPISFGDIYLVKLDAWGRVEWEKFFGGNSEDICHSLEVTADSGYVLGGWTYSFGSGDWENDAYLIKTDASGNVQWQQAIGSDQEEDCMCVQITSDGGCVLTGESRAGLTDVDVYLVRFAPGGSSPQITITLTPENPPITIPATGGTFEYNINVSNPYQTQMIFNVWVMATLPDSSCVGPLLGPVDLTLLIGGTMERDRTQGIPARAPAGDYDYIAYAGLYPDIIWGDDSFSFEKLANGDGPVVEEWQNISLGVDQWMSTPGAERLTESVVLKAHPNPFNPITTLCFDLPKSKVISLAVYDIQGRLVSTLLDAYCIAGSYKLTFDGSDLTSGIYIYYLTAGDFTASGKLLLVK